MMLDGDGAETDQSQRLVITKPNMFYLETHNLHVICLHVVTFCVQVAAEAVAYCGLLMKEAGQVDESVLTQIQSAFIFSILTFFVVFM